MAALLVMMQIALLGYFLFFAFFNYLYSIASFFYRVPAKGRKPSGKTVAVVIVSFNEKEVLLETLSACSRLTYQNTVVVIGDDSKDDATYPLLQRWIAEHGGQKLPEQLVTRHHENMDIWESPNKKHVIVHRHTNEGFKAGNLKEVIKYLRRRGIDYMFLLDADWRIQGDAIEQALSQLESHENLAFVQTKRAHYNRASGLFQRSAALGEETEYEVELVGRQVMHHPILFTGCCTLFRVKAIDDAGGFTAGHLTEDIDLTNRLYLRGWDAMYLPTVSNEGEIVTSYPALIKQQERWAQGTARTFKEFLNSVVKSVHLAWGQRLSLIRQNMYYTTAVAIELSIVLAFISVSWIIIWPESYQANLYVLYMSRIALPYTILLLLALASNFLPMLITIVKRRTFHELPFVLLSTWLSWSMLHTYFWANVKGLLGIKSDWFKTPKTSGKRIRVSTRHNPFRIAVNMVTLCLFIALYALEWYTYGWINPYAYFWIPAMMTSVFVF